MTSLRPRRRPGRPPGRRSNAAERIRRAALMLFAEQGFEATSVRSIATRADVDAALLHHYFGTKHQLHATVLELKSGDVHVGHLMARVAADDIEELVREVLRTWEDPATALTMRARLRHALDAGPEGAYYVAALMGPGLAHAPEQTSAREMPDGVRAVAAALVGMIVARYLLVIDPWASAPAEELAATWPPVLRAHAAAAGCPR